MWILWKVCKGEEGEMPAEGGLESNIWGNYGSDNDLWKCLW